MTMIRQTGPALMLALALSTLTGCPSQSPRSSTSPQATGSTAPQISRNATPSDGEWSIANAEITQNNTDQPALLIFGDKSWKDYTIELEGQKTGGDEGFLIAVRVQDPQNLVWFNVGGWGNTRTAFEFANGDDGKTDFGDSQTYGPFEEVVTGKWHKLKVVVTGNQIEGFLDGKSACKFNASSLPTGRVAVGTWATQAKFRNIKITTPDGKTLWEGLPLLPSQ